MTSDPESAIAFYTNVFDWDVAELEIGPGAKLPVFELEGDIVAALSGMTPEMKAVGVPSHWINEVTVDSVDAVADVVADLGGTILLGPIDRFERGRMLYIQDPAGAKLNLWQANRQFGAGVVNKPGAMIWNELLTWDATAAKRFYGELLGWEFSDSEVGYITVSNRGRRNGGILPMDASFGDTAAHWRTYFNVEDIDESLKQIMACGGKILRPKLGAPGVGHFAHISDPMGAEFYLLHADNYNPWPE